MLRKQNIFLIGPMGVGKSSVGRLLAKQLQKNFFDSDQVVESLTGANIAWIFDIEGEAGFRKREAKVIDDLTNKQNIILSTGGGTVVTKENRQFLSQRGTVIFLHANLDNQYKRTRRDENRPLLQTENVREKIDQLWDDRLPLYEEIADYTFDTSDKSVTIVCQEIVNKLTNDA